LLAIASGSLFSEYAKEAYKYHGIALAESWIGRPAINIGDLTGQDLYNKLHDVMDKSCPYDAPQPCKSLAIEHGNLETNWIEQLPGKKPIYKASK
jgi:hypothetical protein